jgi:MFS family permease
MLNYYRFFLANKRILLFGMLLVFFSNFGQTFLLSLYIPSLLDAFDISRSSFSSLYATATLLSAVTLIAVGKKIDFVPLKGFTLFVVGGITAACLLATFSFHIVGLFFAVYLLRLFGQGLLSHTALTTMARFFRQARGKALSIAYLGFPLGEGVLPVLVVASIMTLGWRETFGISALFVVLVLLPLSMFLLRGASPENTVEGEEVPGPRADQRAVVSDQRAAAAGRRAAAAARTAVPAGARPAGTDADPPAGSAAGAPHTDRGSTAHPARTHPATGESRLWKQREVIRSRPFYLFAPTVFLVGFLQTALFFFQAFIAEEKGWSLEWMAAGITAYAISASLCSVFAGPLIDRFSAMKLFPLVLLPLGVALLVLNLGVQPWIIPVYWMLVGITGGSSSPVTSALYAEKYGTRSLGTVRSLFTFVMVASTAAAPVGYSFFLERGFGFSHIHWGVIGILLINVIFIQTFGRRLQVFRKE